MAALLGPLWWMWVFTPLLAAFVYVLASKDDPARLRELERWRKNFGPPIEPGGREAPMREVGYRETPKLARDQQPKPPPGKPPKRVTGLPGQLARALRAVGSGEEIAHYELVPRLAYLSVFGANAEESSDFQAVVAKLDQKGPGFTVRPVPIVEGVPQPNTGVEFRKDAEFAELFVVEPLGASEGTAATPAQAKPIRKWLSDPIREALKEMPEAFLRVEGASMSLTYFGDARASDLTQLVTAADVIFAEHGAGGGPSLFGDEDDGEGEGEPEVAPPPRVAAKKKPA